MEFYVSRQSVQATHDAMLHVGPSCSVALNCCTLTFVGVVFSRAFTVFGFPFVICSAVTIFAPVESLHYLGIVGQVVLAESGDS